ncbi:MAG TPA: glycosyl transferase, partial [Bacteroidia bacterium]|nr:glycosyl transferase [Bacteroidia bacterium]
VYSGSSAGWQSFKMLDEVISKAFAQNPSLKLLMLSKTGTEKTLSGKFPGRIMQKWLGEDEVQIYLQAADYGLLVREKSATNEVSSPVKFAEYLAAGLPVIISEHIGDYSQFVEEKNCGILVNKIEWSNLKRSSVEDKQRIQSIAESYFRKKVYTEQYRKLF